ncbi:MAG: DUF3606 domain-containing protein [Burkholderiales bacterium]
MNDPVSAGLEPRVDPQRIMSLVYWSARFGRAPQEVEAAVAAVGSRAADVATWFGQATPEMPGPG